LQSRRLVIDSNILIRAVLGSRVQELIERYCVSTAFYVADANLEEAVQYLTELGPKRGIREEVWRESLNRVMAAVQIIRQDELASAESEARARIGARDADDWPAVAGALQFDCPVWTEDEDFFGSGVATWTTATVEIFLSAT
jgi:predicted nucleic acid-binding protein